MGAAKRYSVEQIIAKLRRNLIHRLARLVRLDHLKLSFGGEVVLALRCLGDLNRGTGRRRGWLQQG